MDPKADRRRTRLTRLELRNVGVDVGGSPFLRGINIEVSSGELHVLLGPSGSGKTTLLRTIAGLHPLQEGEIRLDDKRIDDQPPAQRGIVLFHQQDTLFPHLTVAGNIGFGLKIRGRTNDEISQRTRELLDLVGLRGFAERRIANLSGGERQRVALARAIAVAPRLLLLDEPFSSLDRLLRQALRDDLKRILRQAGITTLFVTHDRDEALGLADRLILLRDASIVDQGKPERVFSRPATVAAARVLGRRNILSYRLEGPVLQTDRGPFPVPDGNVAPAGWILLNEEDVTLRATGQGSARVDAVEFLGSRSIVRVTRGDGPLYVEIPGAPTLQVGQRVEPEWSPGRLRLFGVEGKTPQS